jgi:UDP-N-acetylglucosamine--N-acetylmuramyl-(pentapeptide) pyrophosphoryl-undecaprenol N-acetylglucosamine transferase
MLDDLMKEGVQVIWQCGKPYHEQAKSRAAAYGSSVKVFDFIREMNYAYAAANIVVSRAGALAIAELCIAAKPVIFVPYPYAAENHQESNARALVERNAAMMVRDNEAMTELGKKLKVLLHDTDMQEIMTQHLKELAIRDADERIAKKVIELAAGK